MQLTEQSRADNENGKINLREWNNRADLGQRPNAAVSNTL